MFIIKLAVNTKIIKVGLHVAEFADTVFRVAAPYQTYSEKWILRRGVITCMRAEYLSILWDGEDAPMMYDYKQLIGYKAKIGGIHKNASGVTVSSLNRIG